MQEQEHSGFQTPLHPFLLSRQDSFYHYTTGYRELGVASGQV